MRTDEKRYWKKRIPKSTRFDKIVDSYVDWLIETGQTLLWIPLSQVHSRSLFARLIHLKKFLVAGL